MSDFEQVKTRKVILYVYVYVCGCIPAKVRGEPQVVFLEFYLPWCFETGSLFSLESNKESRLAARDP